MSTKIGLWLENFPNPALEARLPSIGEFTRLFCYIRFKTHNGWSDSLQAIVDITVDIGTSYNEVIGLADLIAGACKKNRGRCSKELRPEEIEKRMIVFRHSH